MKAPAVHSLVRVLAALALAGCGHYPTHVTSAREIRHTSRGETHLTISNLPAGDVSAIARLQNLTEIDFDGGASDEHLEALAKLNLPKLSEVVLTDCPRVTDRGGIALTRIATIKGIGLRGTGIGDEACRAIAHRTRIDGINVERSPNVTMQGLLALAQCETIEELCFSLHHLTQADLLRIIQTSRRVNHLEVVIVGDEDRRLNLPELRKAARAKGMMLLASRNDSVDEL